MAVVRLRLCEEDQGRFPRGDEWFEFDIDEVFDGTPVGVQEDIESKLDWTLAEFSYSLGRYGTKAIRARMWMARYLAGVRITTQGGREVPEPWNEFDPKAHRIETVWPEDSGEPAEDDASPPDQAPDQGQTQDA